MPGLKLKLALALSLAVPAVALAVPTPATDPHAALSGQGCLPFGGPGDVYVQSRVDMQLFVDGGVPLAQALSPLLPGGAGASVRLRAAFTFTDTDPVYDYAASLGASTKLYTDPTLLATPGVSGAPGSLELPLVLPVARQRLELGADLDGNGMNDLLEFWMVAAVSDPLRLIVTETGGGGLVDVRIAGTLALIGRVGDAGGHTPFDANLTSVPEPGAAALLALGLAGLAGMRRRQPRRA